MLGALVKTLATYDLLVVSLFDAARASVDVAELIERQRGAANMELHGTMVVQW